MSLAHTSRLRGVSYVDPNVSGDNHSFDRIACPWHDLGSGTHEVGHDAESSAAQDQVQRMIRYPPTSGTAHGQEYHETSCSARQGTLRDWAQHSVMCKNKHTDRSGTRLDKVQHTIRILDKAQHQRDDTVGSRH